MTDFYPTKASAFIDAMTMADASDRRNARHRTPRPRAGWFLERRWTALALLPVLAVAAGLML